MMLIDLCATICVTGKILIRNFPDTTDKKKKNSELIPLEKKNISEPQIIY